MPDIQLYDGHTLSFPDGTAQSVIDSVAKRETFARKAQATNANPAALASAEDKAMANPTAGSSFLNNLTAGTSKAAHDSVHGIHQLGAEALNAISPKLVGDQTVQRLRQQTDETNKLDAPLMDTGGGMTGNVAGNLAMMLAPGGALKLGGAAARLSGSANLADALKVAGGAAMVPKTVLGAGAQGAALGATQPVGENDSRALNTGLSAGFGALIPGALNVARGTKALIEPMYQGGRDAIVGRALKEAAGNDPAVIGKLLSAREVVPGSQPTAAQVAENGGIAALERMATQADPTAYAQRSMSQSAARVSALREIAGTESDRNMQSALRDYMSSGFYKMARQEGIDPKVAKALQPQIDNLTERMPTGVMEKARELARIKGEAMGAEGSVSGLHYIKKAVDDLIDGSATSGMGKQTKSALLGFKSDLLKTMEELSPKYMQGNRNFSTFSKPINQQEVGQYLLDKIQPALADHGALAKETSNSYALALRNAETTASKSTGFSQPLEKIMSGSQMDTLNGVAQDLGRKSNAQELGKGAGSNTFQNLSMANIAQRSGIPTGILKLPGAIPFIGPALTYGAERIGNEANETMRRELAHALLDPKKTAELMREVTPSKRAALAAALTRNTLQPMAAATPALLNANQ